MLRSDTSASSGIFEKHGTEKADYSASSVDLATQPYVFTTVYLLCVDSNCIQINIVNEIYIRFHFVAASQMEK